MQRKRWIAVVCSAGILVAVAGMVFPVLSISTSRAVAQDEATAVGSPAVSPVASPGASPVPSSSVEPSFPVFMSGIWRISIVFASRAPSVPELDQAEASGRDWIVVVADVTNWSGKKAKLSSNKFNMLVTGETEPAGFNRLATEAAAKSLNLEPKSANAGVEINSDKSKRLVLLFRVDKTAAEISLVPSGAPIPLSAAFEIGGSLDNLPKAATPPELVETEVTDTTDGATLQLNEGPLRLAGVDSPVGEECFADQSTRRLERLAGSGVLLESGTDLTAANVWIEDDNGLRKLLNREVIASGSAAFATGTTGPYAGWLQDADRDARTRVVGLWASCTNQHGVARQQKPETTGIKLESDGSTRSYAVWVAWAPTIITKPDGSAYVFFSAEAASGSDKGNKRLYYSRYDAATGAWSQSIALPGGEVQMGPSAVVDGDGIVHLVYCDRAEDKTGVFSEVMYTHEDGKGGWVEPAPISREATSGFQLSPSLSIDNLGVLHVAWQDQRAFAPEARDESAANADIFVSDLVPGASWSIPVLVNTHFTDAAGSRPHIVADGERLVMVWSVYAASLGLNAAARVEWATRPLDDPLAWTAPKTLIVGRGEGFGGRLLDLAADPTGGVVMAYGRQATDTFLFLRRLGPGAAEWGGDTLLTYGDRGTFPSITISDQGVVYVVYNVGAGASVDVGAVAIPYRSIEPGPEVILTEDQEDTQGRPIVSTDITGRPWIVYFNEPPGGISNEVRVLRNAEIPATVE